MLQVWKMFCQLEILSCCERISVNITQQLAQTRVRPINCCCLVLFVCFVCLFVFPFSIIIKMLLLKFNLRIAHY